jgi:hypothetical protein
MSRHLKIGEHSEHAAVVIWALWQLKFGEDAPHVSLNGAIAEAQPFADGLIGAALGHQGEHVSLTAAQPVQRVVEALVLQKLLNHQGSTTEPPEAITRTASTSSSRSDMRSFSS